MTMPSQLGWRMSENVKVRLNGKEISVAAGTTVAAAVAISGAVGFRQSISGEPRAPLCGMGICFECRVTIDGEPQRRSCSLLVRDGMEVRTDG